MKHIAKTPGKGQRETVQVLLIIYMGTKVRM